MFLLCIIPLVGQAMALVILIMDKETPLKARVICSILLFFSSILMQEGAKGSVQAWLLLFAGAIAFVTIQVVARRARISKTRSRIDGCNAAIKQALAQRNAGVS